MDVISSLRPEKTYLATTSRNSLDGKWFLIRSTIIFCHCCSLTSDWSFFFSFFAKKWETVIERHCFPTCDRTLLLFRVSSWSSWIIDNVKLVSEGSRPTLFHTVIHTPLYKLTMALKTSIILAGGFPTSQKETNPISSVSVTGARHHLALFNRKLLVTN